MDSVQPWALNHLVCAPPLPPAGYLSPSFCCCRGTNEVNLIVPCLASKENCFKRTEPERTLRLASDYAGLESSRALSSPARSCSCPGHGQMTKKKFGGLTSKVNQCERLCPCAGIPFRSPFLPLPTAINELRPWQSCWLALSLLAIALYAQTLTLPRSRSRSPSHSPATFITHSFVSPASIELLSY